MKKQVLGVLCLFALYGCGGGSAESVEQSAETDETDTVSDVTAPTIVSVSPRGYTQVDITFSETLDKASAETAANYSITPPRAQGQSIVSASRLSESVVRLKFSRSLLPLEYTLTVEAVEDAAGNPIEPGSHATFIGDGKVVFLTAYNGTGRLSSWPDSGGADGLDGADNVCQAEADRAGLLGTFKAWMSDTGSDALTRIGTGSGPWVRTDGHPFTRDVLALVNDREALVPISYTADGVFVPFSMSSFMAWTGTNSNGLKAPSGDYCLNWSSEDSAHLAQIGALGASSVLWTNITDTECHHTGRIYCFQTGAGPEIPAFRRSGKIVFVSSIIGTGKLGTWTGSGGVSGLLGADNVCRSLATNAGLANADNFKAWMSDETTDAISRLSSNGPWALLNGVRIAENKADLTDESIFTGISIDESGYQRMSESNLDDNYVWTGTLPSGTKNPGLTCNSWVDHTAGTTGSQGLAAMADVLWTSGGPMSACNLTARIYCFEDE